MKWTNVIVVTLSIGLTACGGGGGGSSDSSTGNPSDKYVGSWASSCQFLSSGGMSFNVYIRNIETISRVDSKTLQSDIAEHRYGTSDCSGSEVAATNHYTETLQFTGSTVIEGQSADKLLVTADWGYAWKDIGVIQGDKFFTGTSNGSNYPVSIDVASQRTRVQ